MGTSSERLEHMRVIPILQSFSNGHTYFGDMREGRRDGFGVVQFRDGGKFSGEFKGGEFHGHGVYVHSTGDRHYGQWDGSRCGCCIPPPLIPSRLIKVHHHAA